MRKLVLALAGAAAMTTGAVANASVVITTGVTTPVPGNNNFQADLAGLGLTQLTFTGATLTLLTDAPILFEFLGSESAASDTFTAGSLSYTENSLFEDHFGSPIVIGVENLLAGSLAGQLVFTSTLGALATATVGQDGFGIFLPANFVSGSATNVFYLGYDDQINMADDNHDDFIVRATVLPEPGTWAMMLFGFGAVGYSMRKARRAKAIPQIA